ncbi:MAG: hypothetical protein R6V06_04590 [Kiritimatiellia bacterium]
MGREIEDMKSRSAMTLYIVVALIFGGLSGCWLRILDVMAGRTVFTLAVFCAVALTGAVAGALASFVGGKKKAVTGVFFCAVLAAAAGYHVFLMRAVGGMAASWQYLLLEAGRDFSLYFKLLLKTSVIFVFFFGILAGAAAMRAFRSCRFRVSVIWSIPGVLAFLFGWWLFAGFAVECCGIGNCLRLLPGLLGAAAVLCLLLCAGRRRIAVLVVALVVAGAYFYIIPLKVDGILSKGTFGRLVYRDSGFAFGEPAEEYNTLRHTVSVFDDRDYQFVVELDNRPLIFGNRFHTSRTLNGYIPLLLRPESEKVLLAGIEAGCYLPFYLRAGVKNAEVSRSPDKVLEVCLNKDAAISGAVNPDVSSLVQGSLKDKYDLIVILPEPLYMRGAAGSFSRGRLRKAADALNEDGILALHVDARGLSETDFAATAAVMRGVFPYMQVWSTGVYEWMFVGSESPLIVNAEKALAFCEKEAVFKDFVRAGRLNLTDVLVCMVCNQSGVDSWLAGKRKGLPGLRKVSWKAPRTVLQGMRGLMTPALFERERQFSIQQWFIRGEIGMELYQMLISRTEKNITARISAVMAIAHTLEKRSDKGLMRASEAAELNPRDVLLVQYAETLELEGRRRILIGDYKGAVRCYENILSFSPGSPQAHYGLGYCLRAEGDLHNAYIHFGRAVVGAPDQVYYRLEFAEVALSTGEFRTADLQYENVLEKNPDDVQTMLLYAKALIYEGREDKNREKAVELAERACEVTGWKVEEAVHGLADIYIEVGRVMEGMGLKRALKEGSVSSMKGE